MKKIIFTSLSLVFAFLLNAQNMVLPLWPEGIPCANDLEIGIEQNEEIGRVVRKVHEPDIAVYLPDKDKATGASVVICPGGGYTILAWDWEGTLMAEWFNSLGIAAFVLKYRLPHWESEACRDQVALQDAQRAMRLVRSKTEEWGLNAEQIGIMGFSAGGHLASTLATHFDAGDPDASILVDQYSSRPDFAILMYPVITMDTAYAHMGSRANLIGQTPAKERQSFYSNEAQVSAETPPTILIHANDDEGVVPENSIKFYLALREHKVPAALHIFAGGGHGFSFAKGKGAVEKWPEVCKAWMIDRGLIKD